MNVRDILEMLLEAIDETDETKEKLVYLFNKIYADHLRKQASKHEDAENDN